MKIRLKVPLSAGHPGRTGLPVPVWGLRIRDFQKSFQKVSASNPPVYENSDPYTPWLTDSRTLRTQSNSRGLVPHPQESACQSWVVELARFVVPDRMFGVVKSFDQFLAINDGQYATTPTASANWGIPFLGFSITDFGPIRWHFRLTEYYGTQLPWVNDVNTANIPGMPHPDLPSTDDMWFPAHSPSCNNFHLPVPGKHVLRVFLQLPSQSVRPYAGARLSGWTSTYLSPEIRHAVRSSW